MKLATFDIFDTTLLRKCGNPDVVFSLVALKLFPDREELQREYVIWRRQAATVAGTDASINDIYSAEGAEAFPGLTGAEVMDAEFAVESEMLTVNPDVRDKIAELRADGWTIKFLSDMYLPSKFLSRILRREGCLVGDEEVIVSCEWGARKDNGTLYDVVRKKYTPDTWIHHGDNLRSDIRIARKNGVKPVRIDTGYTGLENRIGRLGQAMRSPWKASYFQGIMRCARIVSGNSSVDILAADHVAGLYLPFVLFILRQARLRGLKKVHFLSRDGYIMYRIAQALNQKDIELNYLFVSRKALTRAFIASEPEQKFMQIVDRKTLIGKSVSSILSQLKLDRDEIEKFHSIKFEYNKILTKSQEQDFLGKIFNNPDFTPDFISECDAEVQTVREYLIQQGLSDDESQAMVDIGWLGTTRLMVNGILGLSDESNIPTFYVGVRGDVYPRTAGDFWPYFPEGRLDTGATALIENYFSASPYPSTIGYERSDSGEILPIFSGGRNYEDNPVTESNVRVACMMAEMIRPLADIFNDDIFYNVALTAVNSLARMEDGQDVTPMLEATEFDGIPMAKRLSLGALVSLVFLGDRHTAFDRGSLALTVGGGLSSRLWSCHKFTSMIKGRIYRRFILKRK